MCGPDLLLLTALPSPSSCSSVPPRGMVSATLNTIPVLPGPVEIVVRFSSDKLSDIMGDVETTVHVAA